MGILSWLFGRSRSENRTSATLPLSIPGSGSFGVEIVGESHYQHVLERICNGRLDESANKIIEATLVHENDNSYDQLAIRVDISNETVGYLSKSHARHFRSVLKSVGHPGATVTCSAKIVGGWNRGGGDIGHFGVQLDLPEVYRESCKIISPCGTSKSMVLTFELDNADKAELSHCEPGGHVKLWKSPKEPKCIFVYRAGSVGGMGKIGLVPKQYFDVLAAHMNKGMDIESCMKKPTKKGCEIECTLVSEEETKKELQGEVENLRKELTKPYTPSQGFAFRLRLPKTHALHESDRLYLKKDSIEHYIKCPCPLRIEFVDSNGNLVAYKDNEPALVRRLLKAHFSGYELVIKILSINIPNKYTLPYIDAIEARAEVTFSKE